MSGQIFISKKESDDDSQQELISQLKETEERLKKEQDFLEKRIQTEIISARSNAASNKPGALQALKRKKQCEKDLQGIDNAIQTIEYQKQKLKDAETRTNVDTDMGIYLVHKYMTMEQMQHLVDNLYPNHFPELDGDINEVDLMTELDELEHESMNKNLTTG